MSVLSLMRRQTEGEVEVLGHVTSALTNREAARLRSTSIGIVFQSFHLDHRQPLWWNVALPWVFSGGSNLRAARSRAEEILARVGMEGMATRRAGDLSGGQRQRVAIARALMSSPALFIADEPTGNLDEDTADSISNLIFGLTEQPGVTVVVVTHDHEIARRADHVVHLANGRLSSAGTEPPLGHAR
jgi:putative ABC transport system ATP-binding protein